MGFVGENFACLSSRVRFTDSKVYFSLGCTQLSAQVGNPLHKRLLGTPILLKKPLTAIQTEFRNILASKRLYNFKYQLKRLFPCWNSTVSSEERYTYIVMPWLTDCVFSF